MTAPHEIRKTSGLAFWISSLLNLLLGPQALLFLTLRRRVARNQLRSLAGGSLIQPGTILACSVVVWMFVFFISYQGFALM
jgi:hypothetical protein